MSTTRTERMRIVEDLTLEGSQPPPRRRPPPIEASALEPLRRLASPGARDHRALSLRTQEMAAAGFLALDGGAIQCRGCKATILPAGADAAFLGTTATALRAWHIRAERDRQQAPRPKPGGVPR